MPKRDILIVKIRKIFVAATACAAAAIAFAETFSQKDYYPPMASMRDGVSLK